MIDIVIYYILYVPIFLYKETNALTVTCRNKKAN